MFNLSAIQAALVDQKFDAWLLYDFRGSNILARRIADIPAETMGSRRWMYLIPAKGEPQKLVHRIESGALDHLPGEKNIYLKWQELEAGVQKLVGKHKRIAMEYAPRNSNPYVSKVDAGTVELVRSFGAEVCSSGDLVQLFEAVWDESQWQMHQEVGRITDSAYSVVWSFLASEIQAHGKTTEDAVAKVILDHFHKHGAITSHPPIVGVNAHSGDPHYETGTSEIQRGDFVLVDLWAKLDRPRAVYSDLTRVAYIGETVPEKFQKVFHIVAAARDAAIAKVATSVASKTALPGWQVDQACRDVIEKAGYGSAFVHRTGHSIGQETHGNGANMDNLETHEERLVLPGCCFSVEPGIYLPEFGARSEVNVFVDHQHQVHVTAGKLQHDVFAIHV